jgi:hypothetical protein
MWAVTAHQQGPAHNIPADPDRVSRPFSDCAGGGGAARCHRHADTAARRTGGEENAKPLFRPIPSLRRASYMKGQAARRARAMLREGTTVPVVFLLMEIVRS